MKLVIASGKGGAGKTTFAVNLAHTADRQGMLSTLIDCDVEAPNSALFIKPQRIEKHEVCVPAPKIDSSLCKQCMQCVDICHFNALSLINGEILLFPELCHSCGGCWKVCKHNAIQASTRAIGTVEKGKNHDINFIQGRLNIGEYHSPPLIKQTLESQQTEELTIIDAPPGVACPTVETLNVSDAVLLVAEDSPFGLHDFKLISELCIKLGKPFEVIINRSVKTSQIVAPYCNEMQFPIIAVIPEDPAIADVNSRGNLIVDALPNYRATFEQILLNAQNIPESVSATVSNIA